MASFGRKKPAGACGGLVKLVHFLTVFHGLENPIIRPALEGRTWGLPKLNRGSAPDLACHAGVGNACILLEIGVRR